MAKGDSTYGGWWILHLHIFMAHESPSIQKSAILLEGSLEIQHSLQSATKASVPLSTQACSCQSSLLISKQIFTFAMLCLLGGLAFGCQCQEVEDAHKQYGVDELSNWELNE